MSATIHEIDDRQLLDGPATISVMQEVVNERVRQDRKWGQRDQPDGTDRVFALQALAATATTDRNAMAGTVTWTDILREEFYEALAETEPAKLRTELLQVAAVAAAWVEAIDRREQRARELGVFA